MKVTHTIKAAMFLLILVGLRGAIVAQTPATGQAARTGNLRQVIPGHYVYTANNEKRFFESIPFVVEIR
jgi:hypothetical protein